MLDAFIPFGNKGYHGLYLEFKIYPNKLTPEQEKFKKNVEANNYFAVVCYSFIEAKEALLKYLEGSKYVLNCVSIVKPNKDLFKNCY